MKPKMLLAVDEYFPISAAGAIRINSFLKEFKNDYELSLVCGKEHVPKEDVIKGIKYYPLLRPDDKTALSPFHFAKYFYKFNKRLLRLSNKHNYNLILVSIPRYEFLYAITRFKTPYILDIRDLLDSTNYEKIFNRFLPKTISKKLAKTFEKKKKKLLRKAIKNSKITTVAYKGLYDYYTKTLPQYKHKIHYIPNGVDLDYFPIIKKKPSKELRIIYIGNFTEKDYLRPIIKSLSSCKNIKLTFVGEGRERKAVAQLISQHNLTTKTNFTGRIHHKDIHKLAKDQDLGIIMRDPNMPTLLPVSAVEYMAMGLPIIVNDYSELGDFVRESKSGFIVQDPKELPQLVKKIMNNKKSLNAIGKSNRKWIEKHGDRSKIAKDFKERYIKKITGGN